MRAPPSSDWHRLASCASTNDEAQRLARRGAAEGTVVVAAEQTAGRGRLGRRWHSPRDENLYLSVVLRPPLSPQRAPFLGLCAGLALHRAANEFFAGASPARPRLKLKWPNDLLGALPSSLSDAPFVKLGGILTELVCVGTTIDFVIVGVGCNVNGREFPPEVAATSLCLLGESVDPAAGFAQVSATAAIDRLGELLLVALADFYDLYLTHGAPPIRQAFVRAAELGPDHPAVVVKTAAAPSGTLRGVPLDLGPDGELILRTDSGALVTVLTGDVALAAQVPQAASPDESPDESPIRLT